MRAYSSVANDVMRLTGNFAPANPTYFLAVLLTKVPASIPPDAPAKASDLLLGLGYQEMVATGYSRIQTQVSQSTTVGANNVSVYNLLLGGAIALPVNVPATYIAAVMFIYNGTLNGVDHPWVMITDETFNQVVWPASTLDTVAQAPRTLWSWTVRGTAPTNPSNTADVVSQGLLRSPGTIPWEPPRTQHVFLFPQRVNYVPNPSFEDVGLFGWRAHGTLTRNVGGVDKPNNNYATVSGANSRLESLPLLLTSDMVCISAYVRGSPTSSVRLDGSAGTWIDGPDIAALAGAATVTIEVDCSLVSWTPATNMSLLSQWGATAGVSAFQYMVAGTAFNMWVSDGTAARAYASGANALVAGSRHVVGGVWTAATSSTQHQVDGANFGTAVTQAALAGGMRNSALGVRIGAMGDNSFPMNGNVYGVRIYANGTLIASPDFTRMKAGQKSVIDAQGNTWTFKGAAAMAGTPTASWARLGLVNYDFAWLPSPDVISDQMPLTSTWTRLSYVTRVPDLLAGSGMLVTSDGSFDIDLTMLEQTAELNSYFDGDSNTGILGDFSWQGVTHQTLSFWYNNRYLVGARLFGQYQTGMIAKQGMVYDWVPAGTSIYTHWDVLSATDTKQPLGDFPVRSF